MRVLSCIIVGVFLFVHSHAGGESLKRYVTDGTSSLTQSELVSLEERLSMFDKETSTQIIVVIVPTIESGSIEEASLRVAEENGIGKKDKNNGVLLFIAKDDRSLRIEVGYGLEGVLTDVLSGQIIRREIIPKFRDGHFFAGVSAGVDAIIAVTRNEYTADPSSCEPEGMGLWLIVFVIMLVFFFSMQSRRRGILGGVVPPVFLPRGGGGNFGGWGGGRGGGGFSGGGGSFGGGGASGRW